MSKWYVPFEDDEKVRVRGEVHRMIAPRDQKYQSNFVEVSPNFLMPSDRWFDVSIHTIKDTRQNEILQKFVYLLILFVLFISNFLKLFSSEIIN